MKKKNNYKNKNKQRLFYCVNTPQNALKNSDSAVGVIFQVK